MDVLYVNLLVADVRRAARFYRDAIGFTVEQAMSGDDGVPVWATLRHGPAQLMLETAGSFGGHAYDPATPPGRGVRLYAQLDATDDLERRFRLAVEHGATVVAEPADQFYGDRSFTVLDPDGYQLSLSQPTGRSDFGTLRVVGGEAADRLVGLDVDGDGK